MSSVYINFITSTTRRTQLIRNSCQKILQVLQTFYSSKERSHSFLIEKEVKGEWASGLRSAEILNCSRAPADADADADLDFSSRSNRTSQRGLLRGATLRLPPYAGPPKDPIEHGDREEELLRRKASAFPAPAKVIATPLVAAITDSSSNKTQIKTLFLRSQEEEQGE